ncbi:hypothetical protein DKX38_022043 [Salix brachista]|uniref:Calreticulin n=1 Tax=Salix brachista TaxID=2182728 RepID=A0A5N5K1W1_9ROSI|nr:hypothetical protein DKX38_022043 [Salix brachista]
MMQMNESYQKKLEEYFWKSYYKCTFLAHKREFVPLPENRSFASKTLHSISEALLHFICSKEAVAVKNGSHAAAAKKGKDDSSSYDSSEDESSDDEEIPAKASAPKNVPAQPVTIKRTEVSEDSESDSDSDESSSEDEGKTKSAIASKVIPKKSEEDDSSESDSDEDETPAPKAASAAETKPKTNAQKESSSEEESSSDSSDDEEDGEWTAPTIPNPEYKGPWKPKKIKNPNYQGKWKAPIIDNPDFKDDSELYVYPDLGYVGIELWQVKSGTLFDNVLVSDDPEYAKQMVEETWGKQKDAEKAAFEEAERKITGEECHTSEDESIQHEDGVNSPAKAEYNFLAELCHYLLMKDRLERAVSLQDFHPIFGVIAMGTCPIPFFASAIFHHGKRFIIVWSGVPSDNTMDPDKSSQLSSLQG